MTEHLIIDQTGDHDHFTMLPNLIDDLGLSVYAFRLYAHMRRVAGETGRCWQSSRTLAGHCRMSVGKIPTAKKELVEGDLINIESKPGPHGDYHEVAILDIWTRNKARYASQTQDAPVRSPHERKRSPGETKKNPLRRPPKPKAGASKERLLQSTKIPKNGILVDDGSSTAISNSYWAFVEKCASAIREQDNGHRTPNYDALRTACAWWRCICEAKHDDTGVTYVWNNIDAVLKYYDCVMQGETPPEGISRFLQAEVTE